MSSLKKAIEILYPAVLCLVSVPAEALDAILIRTLLKMRFIYLFTNYDFFPNITFNTHLLIACKGKYDM